MAHLWIYHHLKTYQDCVGHKKGAGSVAMVRVGSSFKFRSPTDDWRNRADAKRRQEKEAAAGASA
jgi:hypothetical protein